MLHDYPNVVLNTK